MKDLLTIFTDHYPSLPPFSDEHLQFLLNFEMEGMGRSLRHIVDYHRRAMLYCKGTENVHVPAEKWSMDVCESLIPEPYRTVFNRIAEAGYSLYHSHKLSRHGLAFRVEKSIPMQDMLGNLHYVTQWSWPVLADPSSFLVANASQYNLHTPWDFNSPPIPFRPMLFVGRERLRGPEDELVKKAMYGILDDLKVRPEWIPVLRCHYAGVDNRKIPGTLRLPSTKVNYYNTKLLEIFRQFSTTFETTRAGVDFLKRQGLTM